jgi:hypothetical protein
LRRRRPRRRPRAVGTFPSLSPFFDFDRSGTPSPPCTRRRRARVNPRARISAESEREGEERREGEGRERREREEKGGRGMREERREGKGRERKESGGRERERRERRERECIGKRVEGEGERERKEREGSMHTTPFPQFVYLVATRTNEKHAYNAISSAIVTVLPWS